MSSYSDIYKDIRQAEFLDRWCPVGEQYKPLPEATPENLRFNIAHRRAAEHELRELKAALQTLRDALDA